MMSLAALEHESLHPYCSEVCPMMSPPSPNLRNAHVRPLLRRRPRRRRLSPASAMPATRDNDVNATFRPTHERTVASLSRCALVPAQYIDPPHPLVP